MAKPILDKPATGYTTPNTQHIMLLVILALLPGTLAYAYFISPIVILNVVVAVIAALLLETLAVYLRKGQGLRVIQDGSIAVAAFLLALAIPPALPFWQILIGVFIMVMLGKHVYGGLGHNPFNPAMVGYAALMISFPQTMTQWFAPGELLNLGIADLIQAKLGAANQLNSGDSPPWDGNQLNSSGSSLWDGITQATPLEYVRSQRIQGLNVDYSEIQITFLQSGWLPINAAFLFGGVLLLWKKIIQWHIPVSVIGSFFIMSLLFSDYPMHYALFSGALMLGAFFIATDPVSTASSKRGRIVFGIGVGTLTLIIREFGGYPEGIAFAILLMNLCVPLIDHLETRFG